MIKKEKEKKKRKGKGRPKNNIIRRETLTLSCGIYRINLISLVIILSQSLDDLADLIYCIALLEFYETTTCRQTLIATELESATRAKGRHFAILHSAEKAVMSVMYKLRNITGLSFETQRFAYNLHESSPASVHSPGDEHVRRCHVSTRIAEQKD